MVTHAGGYHGDSLGTTAISDVGVNPHFPVLIPAIFSPRPPTRDNDDAIDASVNAFATLLKNEHWRIAAVIIEPIVQALGNMHFYAARYLTEVRRLCSDFGILLIADEVVTGFGRTGRMFACEHALVAPDIMCLGKALTGGYLPLAATLCSDKIAKTISPDNSRILYHGPTYTANALACSVGAASTSLLIDGCWNDKLARLEDWLIDGLRPALGLGGVVDVRALGGIGVVETERPLQPEVLLPAFVQNGIWVRPFGRMVYLSPPYIISQEDVEELTNGVVHALSTAKL